MPTLNRTFRILASAAGVIVAVGCSERPTPPDEEPASLGDACSGRVEIQVSFASNGQPSFDWTPRCGISWLTVQTVPFMGAAPVLAWAVAAPELNPVKPVIDYGVLPRGGSLSSGPAKLVQGVTYKITVDQTVGLDASVAHGERTFTIP